MSLRVRTALRGGLTASGASLLADSATADLGRIADATTGGCDADCEKRMAQKAEPGRLLLARLAVVGNRFTLRVTSGGQESSAFGLLVELESAATVAAYAIARPEASLLVEGIARGSTVFIDGVPVTPNTKGVIPVAPGRRLVRVGDGQGPGAMRMIDALPGQIITVPFPPGTDGVRRRPQTIAVEPFAAGAGQAGIRTISPPSGSANERSARTAASTAPRSLTRSPWTWAAAGLLAVLAGGAAAAFAADTGEDGSGATKPYTTIEVGE